MINFILLCSLSYLVQILSSTSTTDAPSQTPTFAPTFSPSEYSQSPTLAPTNTPITPNPTTDSYRFNCGINRYCYYEGILDASGDTIVEINNYDDNADTTFKVTFINKDSYACYNPLITFFFERIDYDLPWEYLELHDNNNATIGRCGGGQHGHNLCNNFTECIRDYPLSSSINVNQRYTITIFESASVDAFCRSYHNYSINAELILTCGSNRTSPTFPPTTSLPTPQPTQLPTTDYPTLPSYYSTTSQYSTTQDRTYCGINRYCYHIDIDDPFGDTTVKINNYDDSAGTTFEVTFINKDSYACNNPLLAFYFERIDYDQTWEYLELRDNNNASIGICGGGQHGRNSCNNFTECIRDYSLSNSINPWQSYTITIYETGSVDAFCGPYHNYSINAELILTCGSNRTSPTLPPTTSLPTPQPTQLPTTDYPTLPSYYSTTQYSTTQDRTYCGINRYCYYIDIDDPSGDTTVKINNYDDNAGTTFEVTFINNDIYDCNNPLITFFFERIDYDQLWEYLDLREANGSINIAQCGNGQHGPNSCNTFTECIRDYPLSINTINVGQSYTITIFESSEVDAFCTGSHPYSVNAELTLTCGSNGTSPTDAPTNAPSATPTLPPTTAYPTFYTSYWSTTQSRTGTPFPTNTQDRYSCGDAFTTRYCYDRDINPEGDTLLNVFSSDGGSNTYYQVTFTNRGPTDCGNPLLTFIFEQIDYNEAYEYLDIFDVNNNLITRCDGGLQYACHTFRTCFTDYGIEINGNETIKIGESFTFTIFEPFQVHDLCTSYHPFSTSNCVRVPQLPQSSQLSIGVPSALLKYNHVS